jgi:hypothetical protein
MQTLLRKSLLVPLVSALALVSAAPAFAGITPPGPGPGQLEDVVVMAPGDEIAVPVHYHTPGDVLDGVYVQFSCNPPSGSMFPVGGTTEVRCGGTGPRGSNRNVFFNVIVIPLA